MWRSFQQERRKKATPLFFLSPQHVKDDLWPVLLYWKGTFSWSLFVVHGKDISQEKERDTLIKTRYIAQVPIEQHLRKVDGSTGSSYKALPVNLNYLKYKHIRKLVLRNIGYKTFSYLGKLSSAWLRTSQHLTLELGETRGHKGSKTLSRACVHHCPLLEEISLTDVFVTDQLLLAVADTAWRRHKQQLMFIPI